MALQVTEACEAVSSSGERESDGIRPSLWVGGALCVVGFSAASTEQPPPGTYPDPSLNPKLQPVLGSLPSPQRGLRDDSREDVNQHFPY